jgi:PAS domain S-box-containing protein
LHLRVEFKKVNQGDSFKNILQHLIDGIRSIYSFDIVTCFILDREKLELTMTNISIEPSKLQNIEKIIGFEISQMTVPLFEGSHFLEVINTKKSVTIKDNQSSIMDYTPKEDLRGLSKILKKFLGPHITYRVPLIVGNEVIGIFGASRNLGNNKDSIDPDLEILEHVAPKAALIVNKAKSDQELQESEKRYRTLIELAPDPIIIVDTKGLILDANSALMEKSGFKRDEIVNLPFSEAPFLPAGTASQSMERFGLLLKGKLDSPYEVSWNAKNGASLNWEIRISAIKENGVTTAFQSIARDVTHRKALEQELHDKNHQLVEKNIALKEILNQLESEKTILQNQMGENINRLIIPLVKNLKSSTSESQRQSCELLLRRLNDIIAPFSYKLSSGSNGLTNKELDICDMIKHGYSSKEIGGQMNISHRTVETHRNSIRKKLNLANSDINLQSYLKTL